MDGTCAKRLTRYGARSNRAFAFNAMVKKNCPAEVKRLCVSNGSSDDVEKDAEKIAAAEDIARANGEDTSAIEKNDAAFRDPLTCLVTHVDAIESKECEKSIRRTVLKAFKSYRVHTPATVVCDEPAERLCGATKSVHDFQAPGSVLACLQRNAASVGDACWGAVATTLEDGEIRRGVSELGTPHQGELIDHITNKVSASVLEEVSDTIAMRSEDFGNAIGRTVFELRKKADQLGTAVSLLVFALLGVAGLAYVALRRAFTLLGRTRDTGKAAGHARNRDNRAGVHNV
jgi:hypothetical protein